MLYVYCMTISPSLVPSPPPQLSSLAVRINRVMTIVVVEDWERGYFLLLHFLLLLRYKWHHDALLDERIPLLHVYAATQLWNCQGLLTRKYSWLPTDAFTMPTRHIYHSGTIVPLNSILGKTHNRELTIRQSVGFQGHGLWERRKLSLQEN